MIINNFKNEFKNKITGYILAGFGFVAALAWNDAIRALIDQILKTDRSTLTAKFVYAVIITIVVVILSMKLIKLGDKKA